VAKVDADADAFSRADVVRARGRYQIKSRKGSVYIASWPRPRGKKKTPLQEAWVNRFKCLAEALKSPFPPILDAAVEFSKGTGWYYRDVMETAAAAKLIRQNDEIRVTTPTVMVHRTTAQNQSGSTPYLLTPNALDWDNNVFWSAVTNPDRLTIRAPGLYLIGAEVNFPNGASGAPVPFIRKNGTTILCRFYTGANGTFQTQSAFTIAYFHALDYIQLLVDIAGSGHNFLINNFWALAITPEAIIP